MRLYLTNLRSGVFFLFSERKSGKSAKRGKARISFRRLPLSQGKRGPDCRLIPDEVIDTSAGESSSKDDPSDSSDLNSNVSSKVSQNGSEACTESEPTCLDITQATQNETSVTTRSGRVVKSTRDNDNFVYY